MNYSWMELETVVVIHDLQAQEHGGTLVERKYKKAIEYQWIPWYGINILIQQPRFMVVNP